MDIDKHFPDWITTLFSLIGLWSFTLALNESIKLILILSFFVPVISFIFWRFNRSDHLQNLIYFRNIACAFSIILSFLLLVNHDKIDLALTRNFLHKFHREYFEETDGNGQPYGGYNYYSSDKGKTIMFLVMSWIFFALIILLPYLTYILSNKYIDRIETQGGQHSKMGKNIL